VQDRVI